MSDYGSDVEDDSEHTLANVGFHRRGFVFKRVSFPTSDAVFKRARARRGRRPPARFPRRISRSTDPASLFTPRQPAVVDKYKVAAEIANSAWTRPLTANPAFRDRALQRRVSVLDGSSAIADRSRTRAPSRPTHRRGARSATRPSRRRRPSFTTRRTRMGTRSTRASRSPRASP